MLADIVAICRTGPEENAEMECYGAMVSLGPDSFVKVHSRMAEVSS